MNYQCPQCGALIQPLEAHEAWAEGLCNDCHDPEAPKAGETGTPAQ